MYENIINDRMGNFMFNKNILIILLTLPHIIAYGSLNQPIPYQQSDKAKRSLESSYTIGTCFLINTLVLATTYVAASYITKDLDRNTQATVLKGIGGLGLVTTTGSVIVEGINCVDRMVLLSHEQKEFSLKNSLQQT